MSYADASDITAGGAGTLIRSLQRIPERLEEWARAGRITGYECRLTALGITVVLRQAENYFSATTTWIGIHAGAEPAVDHLLRRLEKGLEPGA